MTPGCETPHERAKRHLKDGGYTGGHGEAKSDAASDRRMIRSAITQHDDQLHGGKKTRLKFKRGGHVDGKKAEGRPDRKRRASGGDTDDFPPNPHNLPVIKPGAGEGRYVDNLDPPAGGILQNKEPKPMSTRLGRAGGGKIPMNGVVPVDRRYEAEGIDQPHGPKRRADGGATDMDAWQGAGGWMNKKDTQDAKDRMAAQKSPPKPDPEQRANGGAMHHKGGKGKIGAVNIAIKAGGGQAEKQMAAQKGLQAGLQIGARQAAAKMGGAPAGGPPPGGMPPGAMPPGPMAGPPPGGPPPGGMMPGPGPMRPPGGMAGGPPPGAMPPPRPPGMMANGGVMRRDAHGRFAGGGV